MSKLSIYPQPIQRVVRGFLDSFEMASLHPTKILRYKVVIEEAGSEGGPPYWTVKIRLLPGESGIANLTDFVKLFSDPSFGWGVDEGYSYFDIRGYIEGYDVLFEARTAIYNL